MMICHYFSFLIDEILLDLWNNILLFLFSALTELNLICGIWAFSIIRDWPLGSSRSGLYFELASGGPGTHHFFGLDEWAGEPVFLILSYIYIYFITIQYLHKSYLIEFINKYIYNIQSSNNNIFNKHFIQIF